MSEVILDIVIADDRWKEAIAEVEKVAEKVKTAAFGYVQAHEDLEIFASGKPLSVAVCLSNDAEVQRLNKDFRGMDKPTNVLSFANMDFTDFAAENSVFAEIELGDIIVAYETMQREAEEQQVSLYAHFCHLLTHGFLHILGYDHMEADEAAYMENLEKEILSMLEIANPYEEE